MPATAISPLELARRERHLTQRQLADRAGVDVATVSRAERGKPLTLASAFALARVLSTDPRTLFDATTSEAAPAGGSAKTRGTARDAIGV